MITQIIKNLTIAIILLTSVSYAGFINPLSECNIKQAQIMATKCNKLNDVQYTACERESLEEFFKCVANERGAKDGN